MNEMQKKSDEEKDTGRLEAFSDGVFAVAITLLILDVKIIDIPSSEQLPPDSAVWSSALTHLPRLSAFIISFFTIGVMWINHHRLFKHIKHTDTGLLLLNLLLLLIIVFIPVPTTLLADYLLVIPGKSTAAIMYSVTFFIMAICFNALWRYAAHHNRLLGKNANVREVEAISRQYLFGPLLYVIPIILALISTPACALFQFALALFFAIPGSALRPQSKRNMQGTNEANEAQEKEKQEEKRTV